MKILVTGSSGLIGGEAVEYFDKLGHQVIGVDNNMRQEFFGQQGDTSWNLHRIFHKCQTFIHEAHDIRDRESLAMHVFDKHGPFDAVIHCAAQPSHDRAREIPLVDFEVNALGTMNLLELTRQSSPDAVFVFMSTNKVYGDAPNEIPMIEHDTRFDYATAGFNDIDETMRIDRCTHSVFGASKVAADIMVQEYGRYYGLKTCVFRGGCLTGPTHSSTQLHGFLSYLVKCAVNDIEYTVIGYKGKQVRDNIHSYDVTRAIEAVIQNPRPGEVYNLGGGRANSISVLEALHKMEVLLDRPVRRQIIDENRVGDHICYVTNMSKFHQDYPEWSITKPLDRIFTELIGAEQGRQTTERYIPGDGGDDYFESYADKLLSLCHGRVIDIGCGHGYLTKRIAERPTVEHVTGTDRHIANQAEHSKIFYWKVTTEELAHTDNNIGLFNTIISTEHIEHLGWRTQDELLGWIRRHLHPNGVFIGSMPNPDDPENPNIFHLATHAQTAWNKILTEHFRNVIVKANGTQGYCWTARKPRATVKRSS